VANKKKSKKRRRGAPPGIDVNEQRRQRLEARRQAKEAALEARRRAERRQKVITRVLAGLLVVGLLWFFFLRTQRPSEIAGHELELLSESGSGRHVTTDVNYPTVPPVSGEHAGQPTTCGKFDSRLQDENLVHTLEHGAVGLFFDPERASQEDIESLEAVVDEYDSHIFSAPYPQMPTAFAIASWGEMMRLDELDAAAVREYVDTFREKGPEKIDCRKTSDSAFQPAEEPRPDEGGNDN
jgi:hypothetical protein